MGCGRQDLGDGRRRSDDLLEVVEHQQRMLIGQGAHQDRQRRPSAFIAKAACDRSRHQLGVVEGCKIDKCRAVGKSVAQVGGGLQCQPCLADATWTDQCEQPRFTVRKQRPQVGKLPYAADQQALCRQMWLQ